MYGIMPHKRQLINRSSILLFAKSPLQNLWKDGRENKGAYVSDFFIRTATSKAHVISSFLQKRKNISRSMQLQKAIFQYTLNYTSGYRSASFQ